LDLGIADHKNQLAVALAYFPLDSIVEGICAFQAKNQLIDKRK